MIEQPKPTIIWSTLVLLLFTLTTLAQQNACINFSDHIERGTYGAATGYLPGDELFTANGVRVQLENFQYFDGSTGFLNAEINEGPIFGDNNGDLISGNYIIPSNVNLLFDFTGLSTQVTQVCFNFINGGGMENIAVNGQPILAVQGFAALAALEVAPGVVASVNLSPGLGFPAGTLCLTGNIQSLLIGGQETAIDNICYIFAEEEEEEDDPTCTIHNLRLRPQPCTPNGIFFIETSFEFDNGGNAGYIVEVNGQVLDTFSYDAAFPRLGPFPGDGRSFEVVVRDARSRSCRDSVRIGPILCSNQCQINNLQAGLIQCSNDEADGYCLSLDFNRPQGLFISFDVFLNGALLDTYTNQDLPLQLSGLEFPDSMTQAVLRVCANNFPNCCLSDTLPLLNRAACVNFDDVAKPAYGSATNDAPGTLFHEDASVLFRITGVPALDWTQSFGNLSRLEAIVFPAFSAASGQFLALNSIAASMNFTAYRDTVKEATLDFYHGNGSIALAANGVQPTIFYNPTEGEYTIGPDVKVVIDFETDRPYGKMIFRGNIQTLLVGGANLWIDNLCFKVDRRQQDDDRECRIHNLEVFSNLCDGRSNFFVDLTFEYEDVSDYFGVRINESENFRVYRYSELPLRFGPYTAPLDESLIFSVFDLEQDTCTATAMLEPADADCGNCNLSNARFRDLVCLDNGKYQITIDFDRQYEGETFTIQSIYGFTGTYRYDELPLRLTIPIVRNNDKLIICDKRNGSCCVELGYDLCTTNPPACALTNGTANDVECIGDSQYKVTINFNRINVGETFTLQSRAGFEGTYSYAALPLRLTLPVPLGGFDELRICDKQNPNCCLRLEYDLPCDDGDDTCDIGNLSLVAQSCNADGKYFVKLNFEHEHTDDTFALFVNDALFGNFEYDELPLLVGPFPGDGQTSHIFKVANIGRDCAASSTLAPVACGTSSCQLTGFTAQTSDCQDGKFNIKLSFQAQDVGTSGYLVFVSGQLFGPFDYGDNALVLGPFTGDGTTTYGVLLLDIANPTCYAYVEVGPVDCDDDDTEDCVILDAQALVGSCLADGTFELKINFEHENIAGDSFALHYRGESLGFFALDELPLTLRLPLDTATMEESIEICASNAAGDACCVEAHFDMPNCEPPVCAIGDVLLSTTCNANNTFNLKVNFEHRYDAAQLFFVTFRGRTYGRFAVGDLPIVIDSLPVDTTRQAETLKVCFSNDCCREVELRSPDCRSNNNCGIQNLAVEAFPCNEDGTFDLRLKFTHQRSRNDTFQVFYRGERLGTFNLQQIPLKISGLRGGSSPTERIKVCLSDGCCQELSFALPDCAISEPCAFRNIAVHTTTCDSIGRLSLIFKWEVENPAADSFRIIGTGTTYGNFSYEQDSIILTPFQGDGQTVYRFVFQDLVSPECRKEIAVGPIACEERVWPGDANRDNIANHLDLLYLGVAYGATGPARSVLSSDWQAFTAFSWNRTFSDGVNYAHADCNGDGIVDINDRDAIALNYNQTSGEVIPKTALPGTDLNPPIFVEFPNTDRLPNGLAFTVPVMLGSSQNFVESIYGIAFTIEFDPLVIDPASIQLSYPNSWFGAGNSNVITFDRVDEANGRIHVAMTRIDGINVAGFGAIAMISGIIDDIAGRTATPVNVTNVLAHNSLQEPVPLHTPTMILKLQPQSEDQPGLLDLRLSLRVVPNPTTDQVQLYSRYNVPIHAIQLLDTSGRPVRAPEMATDRISLANVPRGMYILRIQIGEHIIYRKVVKQ